MREMSEVRDWGSGVKLDQSLNPQTPPPSPHWLTTEELTTNFGLDELRRDKSVRIVQRLKNRSDAKQ